MIIFTLYPTSLRLPSGCNTAQPTVLAHKTVVIEAFDLREISAYDTYTLAVACTCLNPGGFVAFLCETHFSVADG